MNKISRLAMLALIGSFLMGCAPTVSENQDASKDENTVIDTSVLDEYQSVLTMDETPLKKPSAIITSRDDMRYVLDWMAFYRVSDELFFIVDKSYASTFQNPYQEFMRAYQESDLADVYAGHISDTHYSSKSIVGIKYSMSKDIASNPAENVPTNPIVASYTSSLNVEGIKELAIDTNDLEEIECETSEQLYYLAMNGYRPKPLKGSVAEEIYSRARAVIARKIDDKMSEYEKVKSIYDYLTTEIYYDSETAYSTDTYLVKEQAYYLEGVFLNNCAVCDGKAKAYALLLNMIGIPCYRSTGVSENGDHAWNYVKVDNKWYLSCTTFGQVNMTKDLGVYFSQYTMMLTTAETPYQDNWGFKPQKYADIAEQVSATEYEGVRDSISSISELESALSKIDREEFSYEFEFLGTLDDIQSFVKDTKYEALQLVSKEGNIYTILCLKK